MNFKEKTKQYIDTVTAMSELENSLEDLKKLKTEIAEEIIEMANESGVKTFEVDGKTYKTGYKTKYVATGGELKNPEKRRELFERLEEAGCERADKIVFKDSFFLTENGQQFEAKDAGCDGRHFAKMIESLDETFRKKLIEDKLLSFYVYPVIEESK